MKILVVGDGHSDIHEVAVVSALRELGHLVESFYWHRYFNSQNIIKYLWRKMQNKYLIGPSFNKLNRDLVSQAIKFSPELIFVYRGTHITPKTIVQLKKLLTGCNIFGYNNDDPFAKNKQKWVWRHFLGCVAIYDLVFAYRRHNISEYNNIGAKKVEILMPWYLPSKDKPIERNEVIERKFDVVFIGHYENDGRIDYLKQIAESNCVFGLFGPDWNRAPKDDWLKKIQPILPVRGKHYRETLVSSRIAVCFFSKLNRDTYTRRCFEIPAMGIFMLCQYSDDMAQLFENEVDAVFFHNPADMMNKINYYLENNYIREKIASNGLSRVICDKHDIVSRMKYVLKFAENTV